MNVGKTMTTVFEIINRSDEFISVGSPGSLPRSPIEELHPDYASIKALIKSKLSTVELLELGSRIAYELRNKYEWTRDETTVLAVNRTYENQFHEVAMLADRSNTERPT